MGIILFAIAIFGMIGWLWVIVHLYGPILAWARRRNLSDAVLGAILIAIPFVAGFVLLGIANIFGRAALQWSLVLAFIALPTVGAWAMYTGKWRYRP